MTKILPTAGRVVLFTPSRLTGDGRFAHIDGRKPLAAIVAHVFNDALVNLAFFDSNGRVPPSQLHTIKVLTGSKFRLSDVV